ncbi:MAG: glycosyltransferase family 9 protein [Fusobacteriaceae bacterium]|nr:glycosyltransferase family 9 protein [Fusobacteriaceae bacterium]
MIIHTAFIGDVVLATPLIAKVRDTWPGAAISFLTTKTAAPILENNPALTEILVYDKKGSDRGIKGFRRIVRRIREKRFDLALIPHRYLRSALLAWLAHIPQRTGYDLWPVRLFYTSLVPYQKNIPEADRLLGFAPGSGQKNYPVALFPGPEADQKAAELLGETDGKALILVAPGSRWFTKCWPLQYYSELLSRLRERSDAVIALIGGKEEAALPLPAGEGILDLRGKTTLPELAAVISRAAILVTNDSAPVHIASAFPGVQIHVFFGPTVKEQGFAPRSANAVIYEAKGLSCRPCGRHGGKRCKAGHFRCMMDIKPELVLKRIENSLRERYDAEKNA